MASAASRGKDITSTLHATQWVTNYHMLDLTIAWMVASKASNSCRFPGFRSLCAQTCTPWSITAPSGNGRSRNGASSAISSASNDSDNRAPISSLTDRPFFSAAALSRSCNRSEISSFIQPGGAGCRCHLAKNSSAIAAISSPRVRPDSLARFLNKRNSSSERLATTSFSPNGTSDGYSCSFSAPSPLSSQRGDTSSNRASLCSVSGRGIALPRSHLATWVAATSARCANSAWLKPFAARARTMRAPIDSDSFI